MSDKELATSVRDLFDALRKSIQAARDAGLRVEFDENIEEMLDNPRQAFIRPAFIIARRL